jgi:hypothetical protein
LRNTVRQSMIQKVQIPFRLTQSTIQLSQIARFIGSCNITTVLTLTTFPVTPLTCTITTDLGITVV